MNPFANGWTESDVEAVIARGNPDELLYVPIVVGMNAADCDRSWAETVCFNLATHPDFNVRGNAILGLGHIARTCGELNLEHAIPLITKALSDPHEYVRSHAESAADDLKTYLGVLVSGDNNVIEIKFSKEPIADYEHSPVISIHEQEQDSDIAQPGIFAALLNHDKILATYKIYQTAKDYFFCNKALDWNSWIVIGAGSHIHFLSKDRDKVKTHSLGDSSFSYFMAFYTSAEFGQEIGDNLLLVASGTGLLLFNEEAELVWQSPELAVDGVIVASIKNNVIYGSAEQDPPDGWVDFAVNLKDGKPKEPTWLCTRQKP